jgi:hypothetical protein
MYRRTSRPKQQWTEGSVVRVGFLTFTVVGRVPTPGNGLPDQYALLHDNGRFYSFTPHNGLVRCHNLADAMSPQ